MLDFCVNRLLYKSYYMTFNEEQIRQYKRFVYSISFEEDGVKDIIWEYLNNDDGAEEKLNQLYYDRLERKKRYEISQQKNSNRWNTVS